MFDGGKVFNVVSSTGENKYTVWFYAEQCTLKEKCVPHCAAYHLRLVTTKPTDFAIYLFQMDNIVMSCDEYFARQNRKVIKIKRDGNCFYSSLSHQLFGTQDEDDTIRFQYGFA